MAERPTKPVIEELDYIPLDAPKGRKRRLYGRRTCQQRAAKKSVVIDLTRDEPAATTPQCIDLTGDEPDAHSQVEGKAAVPLLSAPLAYLSDEREYEEESDEEEDRTCLECADRGIHCDCKQCKWCGKGNCICTYSRRI